MSRIKNDLLAVVHDRAGIEYATLNRPIQDRNNKVYSVCYPVSEQIINQIIMDDITFLGGLRILPGVTPEKIWCRDLLLSAPYLQPIPKKNVMALEDYLLSLKQVEVVLMNNRVSKSTLYSNLSRYSEYILFVWKERMISEYFDLY